MQKKVIHDWMNHFNPILNKYNTVKKKLKAKVTERKELNVKKEKTSILNPIQHIKLNQQLTTVTLALSFFLTVLYLFSIGLK